MECFKRGWWPSTLSLVQQDLTLLRTTSAGFIPCQIHTELTVRVIFCTLHRIATVVTLAHSTLDRRASGPFEYGRREPTPKPMLAGLRPLALCFSHSLAHSSHRFTRAPHALCSVGASNTLWIWCLAAGCRCRGAVPCGAKVGRRLPGCHLGDGLPASCLPPPPVFG